MEKKSLIWIRMEKKKLDLDPHGEKSLIWIRMEKKA